MDVSLTWTSSREKLMAETSQPLADYESTGLAPEPDTPKRWWNGTAFLRSVMWMTT